MSDDARDEINVRLVATGWSISRLAREAEVDRADLTKWLSGHKENITTATFDSLRRAIGYNRAMWRAVPK